MNTSDEKFAHSGELIAELALNAKTSANGDDFCRKAVITLRGMIDIETLLLFITVDEETLEVQASHGRPFANLDQGRFLKKHRITPVTDAIRLQRNQAWSSVQKLLLEYPDLIEWPRIMHSVIAIPVIRRGKSVAGTVFILQSEFSENDKTEMVEILRQISELIYSVHERQVGQSS